MQEHSSIKTVQLWERDIARIARQQSTPLRRHLSVLPTLLRSYPTGQARRKESYGCAVRLPKGS